MIEPIKIIDDFYTHEELGFIGFEIFSNYFSPTYQPKLTWYPNRYQAYPCYETVPFGTDCYLYNVLFSKLNPLLNNKIKTLKTFIRKTLSKEVEDKSIFKSTSSLKHQDKDDIAGLIYLNTFSILDGTRLFTLNQLQNEPDLVIGSKINRMIMYKSNIWHEPGFDKNQEVRYIQPFFINLKKENEI